MDDQFYAFLSSAWSIFNSNFWAALAGAFAGAVAASKFAARREKRDDLVRTINETNAAISISYSACEAYLAHKVRLIDPLTRTYQNEIAAYTQQQSSEHVDSPHITLNLLFQIRGNIRSGMTSQLHFMQGTRYNQAQIILRSPHIESETDHHRRKPRRILP